MRFVRLHAASLLYCEAFLASWAEPTGKLLLGTFSSYCECTDGYERDVGQSQFQNYNEDELVFLSLIFLNSWVFHSIVVERPRDTGGLVSIAKWIMDGWICCDRWRRRTRRSFYITSEQTLADILPHFFCLETSSSIGMAIDVSMSIRAWQLQTVQYVVQHLSSCIKGTMNQWSQNTNDWGWKLSSKQEK